jgi:RNA polymerase sigma-70 factor (ECF subfamily)
MTDSEKIWLKQSKSGDLESFERLIEKYQHVAYNIAYRMVGNEEDAKDITQEAFIKVFKSIASFREDSSFSTWLYRIVMNTCKDELRKKKLKVISIDRDIEVGESSVSFEIPDHTYSPEVVYEKKQLHAMLSQALTDLPEQNRIVVIMRDVQGFSYEDIAECINIPVGTVKSRINRGRHMLREMITKDRILSLETL